MSKRTKTETAPATDVQADPQVQAEPQATPALVLALTDKGKTHAFRAGSQRAIWFASLCAHEGKPVAEWLTAVALAIPAQRVKENAKTPHKGGAGFLGRFKELGLVRELPAAPVPAEPTTEA